MQNTPATLSFVYKQHPKATAPCGSAEDAISWRLTGNVSSGAIVQCVHRTAHIVREGTTSISTAESYFELWDVVVTATGNIAVMGGGNDAFAWHPNGGELPAQPYRTKGNWEIKGVARFLPQFDVLYAIQSGEDWEQGAIAGVGRFLFTLTQTPSAWNQFSGETARILKAHWNCLLNEPRQETDTSGSGPIFP